ncbi:MAG: AraC family transcriptional regulator, partial [Gorillibacterium sp.]|nr:AraC family transcriptional regulator [Gorillibacterium sp.]
MDCIQWNVPPLPQLATIGHGVWTPSMQHFRRAFEVYDVIVVRSGCLYMMEEGKKYEIKPGHLLLLEPGLSHEGYRPCEEETELIWFHIKHDSGQQRVSSDDIPWSLVLRNGTDQDIVPADQQIYLPKFGCFELDDVWAILLEMVRLHKNLMVGSALELQAAFFRLLAHLQGLIRGTATESSAGRLAASVTAYLRKHAEEPFQPLQLEEMFHFNHDYITRCLKRETGMSPLEYLRHIRMDK